ncbi:MAG: IclR family transcriptional regulator [Rubrivivax sp.]|jgi:IclR family pca regulon transcriptional regulator
MPEAPQAPTAADSTPLPGDAYVQSFARGLAVIRSFSSQHPSQTLADVARQTGLTRAGARRILLTLQHLGYVQADGRQFSLTPRILDLGFAYLSSLPLWNLAQPVMEGLVTVLRESCSAAVLDGADIVYVLRVPTHQIMSINLGTGSRLPATCTSMGRVLLAGLPPEEARQRVLAAPRQALTTRTLTDPEAVLAAIQQTRQQGWCLVDQELEDGLISLAAPLRDRAGRTIAALNVSGHTQRTPADHLLAHALPRLLQAAEQISQLLAMKTGGARPPGLGTRA